MELGCEDCGLLDHVEVDGYAVGDRLLEGVIFEFYTNRAVRVRADAKEYFDTLNKKLWLSRIREHVLDGAEDTICPKCKKEAYVEP